MDRTTPRTDARVRYTKKVIRDSFLTILAEKPVNKVTVREICDMAEINRATFYKHYRDPFDLLEKIEDELTLDYMSSLIFLDRFDVTGMIDAVFDMIERNIDLCRVLIFDAADERVTGKIIQATHESAVANWRTKLKRATDEDLELLFTCLSNGLMRVVIDGYNKYPRKKLIEFVALAAKSAMKPYL